MAAVICLAILAAACRPAGTPENAVDPPPTAATVWPAYDFSAATAAGETVYRLDPENSRIDVVVRRDGPLARFGHDHVVVVREAQGFLLLTQAFGDSRLEMRFPVAALDVDPSAERSLYRLDTEPDADDIAGTKRNLLEMVLDSNNWPFIHLTASGFSRQGQRASADITFWVNGSPYTSRQSFSLSRDSSNIRVEGAFTLRQSELGIEPFSALGGGLRVADEMEMHFSVSGDTP